jgi:hypothetical protein
MSECIMPTDQNQPSGRRQHFHRRRGPDKRGNGERRHQPSHGQDTPRNEPRGEHVDVEQIMRDIRGRIAQRHGIELSNAQIQELAARRLEAILDPRTVKPSLLEQLRRGAGAPVDSVASEPAAGFAFEDDTMYESQSGFVRFMRRLLQPVLKLFFNPNPLIQALNTQAKLNLEAGRREQERERRQAEWNALHFSILQRLVVEISRTSVEVQSLASRVEALDARLEFNDRRVRGLETAGPPPAPAHAPRPHAADAPASTIPPTRPVTEGAATETPAADGTRRRRRRRRGRRNGPGQGEGSTEAAAESQQPGDAEFDDDGGDDGPDTAEPRDADPSARASEPASMAVAHAPVTMETAPPDAPAEPRNTDRTEQ